MEAQVPIKVQSTAFHMGQEQYEGLIARLGEMIPTVPGFLAHGSWLDEEGVQVVEFWESREAFDSWYQTAVEPNVKNMHIEVEVVSEPIAHVFLAKR
jgi:heme-degrading monooxygenase HmoA